VTSKYAFTGEGNSLAGGSEEGSKGKRAARYGLLYCLYCDGKLIRSSTLVIVQGRRGRSQLNDGYRHYSVVSLYSSIRGSFTSSISFRLAASSTPKTPDESSGDQEGDGSDSEGEFESVKETDAERRQTLLSSKTEDDEVEFIGTGKSWQTFLDDFDFTRTGTEGKRREKQPLASGSKDLGTIDISSDDDDGADGCDVPRTAGSMSTVGVGTSGARNGTGKGASSRRLQSQGKESPPTTGALGLGKLVQTEIDFRKKESLGMAPVKGGGRTLGSAPRRPSPPEQATTQWSCKACTL
jgi:DNA-dependent metalloprotease WSS1